MERTKNIQLLNFISSKITSFSDYTPLKRLTNVATNGFSSLGIYIYKNKDGIMERFQIIMEININAILTQVYGIYFNTRAIIDILEAF